MSTRGCGILQPRSLGRWETRALCGDVPFIVILWVTIHIATFRSHQHTFEKMTYHLGELGWESKLLTLLLVSSP